MYRTRGTGSVTKDGYILHTRKGVQKFEHVLIAEHALGKMLPAGAGVHHVNGIKTDNRNENLVIFPNQGYHALIHKRTAAYDATGDANKRKCTLCGDFDFSENLYIWGKVACHRKCKAIYDKNRNGWK